MYKVQETSSIKLPQPLSNRAFLLHQPLQEVLTWCTTLQGNWKLLLLFWTFVTTGTKKTVVVNESHISAKKYTDCLNYNLNWGKWQKQNKKLINKNGPDAMVLGLHFFFFVLSVSWIFVFLDKRSEFLCCFTEGSSALYSWYKNGRLFKLIV